MNLNHALIEPLALNLMLREENLVVLDATYGMGGTPPRNAWKAMRIGNAQFFDIDVVADPLSLLPHMLPSPDDFAAAVAAMGVSNDDRVVIYDQTGIAMAAARAWWMFRVFGHDNVAVLNGGLPAWRAANLPLSTIPPHPPEAPGTFKATFRPELVRNKSDVIAALSQPDIQIVDARSPERFMGTSAEPRPGLRSGRIPTSSNVPYMSLIDPVTNRMKDADNLATATESLAAKPQIISSCGSGVTACVLALALHTLGRADVAVYDGSWVEWGSADAGTPVDSGPVKV
jgi:thiosulfate/3-mercaptopyruvate sulfurtransferase